MTPISWFAHIIDLNTDIVVATTTEIIAPAWTSTIDSYGKVHVEIRPGTAFCDALIAAWGGPTYIGAYQAYLFELFQDGGILPDCSMWVEKGQVNYGGPNVGVVLDGNDIASGFDRSYIDEATYIDCYIEDVLGADPGKIRINSSHLITNSNYLPIWWRGLYNHVPGRGNMAGIHRLKHRCITNSRLRGNKVDTDVNTDSIFRTTTNVIASASAVFDPLHPELFGADQHFTFDTMNRLVYAGYRGNQPVLDIRDDITPLTANEATQAAIVDGDTGVTLIDLTRNFAQTEFKGGSSTHNMPEGGSFTGAEFINKPTSGDSTGEYDNLLIVGITTGNGGGCVATWLGDGTLRQLSQTMDVTDLKLDGTQNILYAATPHGIYYRNTIAPYPQADWTRLGDTATEAQYEYTSLWIPLPGVVYAVASGNNNGTGVNGVWRYDVAHPGWKKTITQSNLVYASGSDGELYYVTSIDPTTLYQTAYPTTASVRKVPNIGTAHIVGLDFDANQGEVVVRTELGANGLYRVIHGNAVQVDPVHSLADGFGPLAVAEFLAYSGVINGKMVNGLALTDRGLYWRETALGPFFPTDGQSGIQNVNGTSVAVGRTQTIMGRPSLPIAILSGSEIYMSRDGGIHFRGEMAQVLDALPAWYEAIKRFTGHYPTGDVAAFGSFLTGYSSGTPIYDGNESISLDYTPTDPEGNGVVVLVPSNDELSLPDNWIAARRWTANNTLCYRLLDTKSNAPYNATRPAEMVEIQADISRSVLDGSSAVMTGSYRFLAQAIRPLFAKTVTITYSHSDAKARFIINGDMVKLNQYVAYTNTAQNHTTILCEHIDQPMIVINKSTYTGESNETLVDLDLVNDAAFSLLDLEKIIAGLANGQAKDRRLKGVRIR